MKKSLLFTLLMVLSFQVFSEEAMGNSETNQDSMKNQDQEDKQPDQLIVTANNIFALDLYAYLREEGKNSFFSPYSIFTAMGMVYEGSRGKTAEEMQSLFRFPEDPTVRQSSFAIAYDYLNRTNRSYDLQTANAFWFDATSFINKDFKKVITEFYKGEAFSVDFINNSETELIKINKWVASKTKNKIKEVFSSLDPLTRVVLANAIYFKGDWEKSFEESQTKSEIFWLNEDESKQVPMMNQNNDFNYAETEELQVLEMPYEDGELSMLVLLPKDRASKTLSSLEESLTIDEINSWKESLRKAEVNVFMPKFTFTEDYDLTKTFQEMGMLSAFYPGIADFSGISQAEDLVIDKIAHKAFVEVNEEGTTAVAVTGIGWTRNSVHPSPKLFKADRPFLFLIQERKTGYILFMGKVADPLL